MTAPAAPSCRDCGKPRTRRTDNRGWNGCHGWCPACSERWRKAGKPAEGPPPPPGEALRRERISAGLRRWHATHSQSQAAREALAGGNAAAVEEKASRVCDYLWLVSFGESPREAAQRVGVSVQWARFAYGKAAAQAAARRDAA